MDLVSVGQSDFCGSHSNVRGKNAREHWKYENHKVLYGPPEEGLLAHPVQN